MMRASVAVALINVFGGGVVGGCLADRTTDGDVVIECNDPADCPDGFVCRPLLGRCLSVDGLDENPPTLEGNVAPDRVAAGTPVTMTVVVNEALLKDPRVPAPFELVEDETDRAALTWVFRAEITKQNIDEGEQTATVSLIDAAGNPANDLTVGSFVTDFTGPEARGFPDCFFDGPVVRCTVRITEIVDVSTGVSGVLRETTNPASARPMVNDTAVAIAIGQQGIDPLSDQVNLHIDVDETFASGPWEAAFVVTDLVGNNGAEFASEILQLP